MTMRYVPVLALSLMLLAACGEPGGSSAGAASPRGSTAGPPSTSVPGTGTSTGSLWHRTFRSTAVTSGGRARPLVPGTRILLAFEPGRLRAEAGCNQLAGAVRVDGGRLVVPVLSTTDKYCGRERQQQDAWLSAFLTSGPSWALDGNALVLRSAEVEVRLADQKTE